MVRKGSQDGIGTLVLPSCPVVSLGCGLAKHMATVNNGLVQEGTAGAGEAEGTEGL